MMVIVRWEEEGLGEAKAWPVVLLFAEITEEILKIFQNRITSIFSK